MAFRFDFYLSSGNNGNTVQFDLGTGDRMVIVESEAVLIHGWSDYIVITAGGLICCYHFVNTCRSTALYFISGITVLIELFKYL